MYNHHYINIISVNKSTHYKMPYLLQRVYGHVIKLSPTHYSWQGCVLRAVDPENALHRQPWSHAVLTARNMQMIFRHPTKLDIHQTYNISFDVYQNQHRLLVNQNVVDVAKDPFGFRFDVYCSYNHSYPFSPPLDCLKLLHKRFHINCLGIAVDDH